MTLGMPQYHVTDGFSLPYINDIAMTITQIFKTVLDSKCYLNLT